MLSKRVELLFLAEGWWSALIILNNFGKLKINLLRLLVLYYKCFAVCQKLPRIRRNKK